MLHHQTGGPDRDPTLLLIHVVGADSRMWAECAALWNGRWRTLACDLRGAGRTPPSDRPWRPEDHVADLEALRAALGVRRVIPIGCASGATIAACYAAAHPERTAALVLSDPVLRTAESSRERVEARLAQVLAGGMQAVLPGAIDLAFANLPRDEHYARYTERFRGHDPTGYAMLARGMLGNDLTARLRSIRVPALVTVGEHDQVYPPERAREVHAEIAGAEFALIEGAAHFPPYQRPQSFARLVADFLERKAIA